MAKKVNHAFYKSVIKKYGISAKGVHWNSQFTQYKRFEVLTNFIKSEITPYENCQPKYLIPIFLTNFIIWKTLIKILTIIVSHQFNLFYTKGFKECLA